jgi:hypothetical protein
VTAPRPAPDPKDPWPDRPIRPSNPSPPVNVPPPPLPPARAEWLVVDWQRRLDRFCAALEAQGLPVDRTGPLSVRVGRPA